jgi:hypothetical protein
MMYNKGQTPNEKENLPFFSLFLFFFFFLLKIKFKTFFLSFVSFVSTERRIYNAAPLPSCSLTSAGFLSNKSPGHIEEEKKIFSHFLLLLIQRSVRRPKRITRIPRCTFRLPLYIYLKRYSRRFFSLSLPLTYINCAYQPLFSAAG